MQFIIYSVKNIKHYEVLSIYIEKERESERMIFLKIRSVRAYYQRYKLL
jgi:hypothetical protein